MAIAEIHRVSLDGVVRGYHIYYMSITQWNLAGVDVLARKKVGMIVNLLLMHSFFFCSLLSLILV